MNLNLIYINQLHNGGHFLLLAILAVSRRLRPNAMLKRLTEIGIQYIEKNTIKLKFKYHLIIYHLWMRYINLTVSNWWQF